MIEYAEEYPKREKFTRLFLAFLTATFIVITHEKWVFPYISWYTSTVHCHNPLGYSGISVLWYSLFVGLPLFSALLVGVFSIPLGIKGLCHKQFPPKGVKVYKPTKITRGWRATIKSVFHLLIPALFILMSVWGYFQVDTMPKDVPKNFDYNVCENS